jgi:UPF0042 nucleotide-binding protein
MMIANMASTLTEAIKLERRQFERMKSQAHKVIDTTLLKPKALQDILESSFFEEQRDVFRVSFVSFG